MGFRRDMGKHRHALRRRALRNAGWETQEASLAGDRLREQGSTSLFGLGFDLKSEQVAGEHGTE
jgi:hypothetical protein